MSLVRVAMLAPRYPPVYGGGGTQAQSLAQALVELGVEVKVLTHRPAGPDVPRRDRVGRLEVRRFRTPALDERRRLLYSIRAALWLLVRSDWDVLHVHGFSYYAVLPVLVAHARGRPVLAKSTLLGSDGAPRPGASPGARIVAAVYRTCEAIVALSDALERGFLSDGRFRGRILRIPNGVDTERFCSVLPEERQAARRAFGLAEGARVLLTAGQLDRRKNVVELVRTLGRTEHRPTALVLAGPPAEESDYEDSLEREIAALPTGVETVRPGTLPPARLAELMRAADLFVLVSSAEGLPNALLEAMASGLACVATDIPGTRDVLEKGGGILVPLGDWDALLRALEELGADRDRCEALGREARRVVEREYELRGVARRYLEAYRDLTGDTSTQRDRDRGGERHGPPGASA